MAPSDEDRQDAPSRPGWERTCPSTFRRGADEEIRSTIRLNQSSTTTCSIRTLTTRRSFGGKSPTSRQARCDGCFPASLARC